MATPPPLPTRLVPPPIPFNRGRPGETTWNAQDLRVAVGDQRKLGAVAQQQFGVSDLVASRLRTVSIDLQWVPAPPGSHVNSFALWDARRLLTKRTPDGQYLVDSPAQLPPSRIYVRFRPSKEGLHKTKRQGVKQHRARGITQYVYYSSNHTMMENTYAKIHADRHPGEVIYRLLVDEVPYQRVY